MRCLACQSVARGGKRRGATAKRGVVPRRSEVRAEDGRGGPSMLSYMQAPTVICEEPTWQSYQGSLIGGDGEPNWQRYQCAPVTCAGSQASKVTGKRLRSVSIAAG